MSGNWVNVSGNPVFVYISGGSVATTSPAIDGVRVLVSSNGVVAISSVVTTVGKYLEWVTWHTTSAAATSAEFYVTVQDTSSVAFKTKVLSINLAERSTKDLFFQPDNRLLLISGSTVFVDYSNPESLVYGCEIMFSNNT
jgi:hypothetical protein